MHRSSWDALLRLDLLLRSIGMHAHDATAGRLRALGLLLPVYWLPVNSAVAGEEALKWTLDLATRWSYQPGIIEFQMIHVGRDRVTDHPSVGIRPQQLVGMVHAGREPCVVILRSEYG